MFGYVTLNEHCRYFRIESDCEQCGGEFESVSTHDSWSLRRRERMQIHDAMKRVAIGLPIDPLSQCTEVVPEMDSASWLDTRQNSSH